MDIPLPEPGQLTCIGMFVIIGVAAWIIYEGKFKRRR